MTASVKPLSPKLDQRRLKVVTIVTTPKSAGVNIRAKITVLITWAASASRRSGYCRCGTANREAPQFVASRPRVEDTTGIKWNHSLSLVEVPLIRRLYSVSHFIPVGERVFGRAIFASLAEPAMTGESP